MKPMQLLVVAVLIGIAIYVLGRRQVASNPFTYSVTARKTVAADLSGIGGFAPATAKAKEKTVDQSCGCLL